MRVVDESSPSFQVIYPYALALNGERGLLLSAEGEVESLNRQQLVTRSRTSHMIVCHSRSIAQKLRVEGVHAFDILELFAFVFPARFVVPTIKGLAQALALPPPQSLMDECTVLWHVRDYLLSQLSEMEQNEKASATDLALAMQAGGWPWAQDVLQHLGAIRNEKQPSHQRALAVWNRLPEWQEIEPERGNPATISATDVRQKLGAMVSTLWSKEPRPQQTDYATGLLAAFLPQQNDPQLVLAEAGTGVGKTLGYLAPSSFWSQESNQPVWISTYTRNLQRQIEEESRRLKSLRTVVRKGRENYLCLLNFEDAVRASFGMPATLITLGLLARWLEKTKDGDLRGGDLPGWMLEIVGRNRLFSLTDRPGECIHSACPHYKKCFIERSIRSARHADVVIANHALVLNAAASGGIDEKFPPTRFIFDEGHHLFHAADSAFGCDLSGVSTSALRRWLVGGDGRSKGRVRGLFKRGEPLLSNDQEGLDLMRLIAEQAALLFPTEGWNLRLSNGLPQGETEHLLYEISAMVYRNDPDSESGYSLECTMDNPHEALVAIAGTFVKNLRELRVNVQALIRLLQQKVDEYDCENENKARMESLIRTLTSFILANLDAWQEMVFRLCHSDVDSNHQPNFSSVTWLGVERSEGKMLDVCMFKRVLDPTKPMMDALSQQAQGIIVTSATLTDPVDDPDQAWQPALRESGACHLSRPAFRLKVPSPFDYNTQTRVLVVSEIKTHEIQKLAEAYEKLFLAAGGGALGLFTAIERLKRVHQLIQPRLVENGLSLHAQHVDAMDPHTLIDIFKADGNACLLGTDAVRDGVDVPGRALRLIVFDKIPWPRMDILMRARKEIFGGKLYVERMARQRLRQGFGRLVRRGDDRGVFVLLSPLPSLLASAFPGVTVQKVTLDEACLITQNFLHHDDS